MKEQLLKKRKSPGARAALLGCVAVAVATLSAPAWALTTTPPPAGAGTTKVGGGSGGNAASAAGAGASTGATAGVENSATGEAKSNAEALFGRYIDLEHAFDPKLVDLYSDTAHIESRIIVPGRPPTVRTWSGTQYKELLRRALKKASEKKEDLNYYSSITYQREGQRVRIKASRYAAMQKAVSPVQLLVGPDATGAWRVYEELSESHPLMAPQSRPKS